MTTSPHLRAVVADDDRTTATALAGTLRRWDLDVRVAHDGLEAWDLMSGPLPPSLAIVDWMMPGLDGLELCRRIRASADHAHMYVLLLTARDSRDAKAEQLDLVLDKISQHGMASLTSDERRLLEEMSRRLRRSKE